MTQQRYLFQRANGYFYWRIRIPADLRRWFPLGEIRKSLKTRQRKEAKTLSNRLCYHTEKLFLQLRRYPMLTLEEIYRLIYDFNSQILHHFEDQFAQQLHVMSPAELTGKTQSAVQEAKEELINGTFHNFGAITTLLDKNGLLDADLYGHRLNQLNREYQKGKLARFQVLHSWLTGDYSKTLEALYPPPPGSYYRFSTSPIEKTYAPAQSSSSLIELIGKYHESQLKSAALQTANENRKQLLLLAELQGNLPVHLIDKQWVRSARDALGRIPNRHTEAKKYKNKTLKELQKITIPQADRRSQENINKYLSTLSSFFHWAVKEGYAESNPAQNMQQRVKKTKQDREERNPFTPEELSALLAADAFTQKGKAQKPHSFWIPIVALYSGMRQNEICQLYAVDIKEKDGIHYFDINEDSPGQKLKTRNAKRLVPVHSKLIGLGFLDYVESIRRAKEARLWPALRFSPSKQSYNAGFTSEFSRLRQKQLPQLTKADKKDFYSFRGMFADKLKQSKEKTEVIAELMGHENESMALQRYASAYELKTLKGAIELVRFEEVDAALDS